MARPDEQAPERTYSKAAGGLRAALPRERSFSGSDLLSLPDASLEQSGQQSRFARRLSRKGLGIGVSAGLLSGALMADTA